MQTNSKNKQYRETGKNEKDQKYRQKKNNIQHSDKKIK